MIADGREAAERSSSLVVTRQVIADLVILGIAIKIIVSAIKRGKQR